MIENLDKKVHVELNDGALCGLSEGAKMDVKSSIIEYVDNAEDANASEVHIDIYNEKHTLTVLSVEETDLEASDYRKLFSLGVSGKLHTKKSGVGKYSQGFKYAGPCLIGEGKAGEVRVAVRPLSGNNWGATHYIDYTNDEKYTDKYINITDDSEMPQGYNFMVKVIGCKNISDNDILTLRVELGIRYREKIENGKTRIYVNGVEVIPQDRLYSKQKVRVDYHAPIFLKWKDDDKAATWEWSDLRRTQFNENELIDYDTSLTIKGRPKGTAVTSRAGIEVAINDVTIIYDGKDTLKSLAGVDAQPSTSGFRGRFNFLNRDFADAYIQGGNKSCCIVNKSFADEKNEETEEIRKIINHDYNSVLSRYHNDDLKAKKYYSINFIDEYCKKYNIDCSFKFSDTDETVEAFVYEKNDNRIIVNVNSGIMVPFKSEIAKTLFIISLLDTCKGKTTEDIWKRMKKFKNNCENDDIIK